ncbi:MAG: hypothetical protein ACFWT7_00775 [Succiniclasticum sp.]|jgi:hypothetical protein
MRIGNRLFPYPVLNQNTARSDYRKESSFAMLVDSETVEDIADGKAVLKGIRYTLTDPTLSELAAEGKVKCFAVLECSDTVYRMHFEVTQERQDISIPLNKLSGKVEVSGFLLAADDMDHFQSRTFGRDYKDYTFSLEKYCILAVDDSLSFTVLLKTNAQNKQESIFTVINGNSGEFVGCSYTNEKINILLPKETYDLYASLKNHRNLDPIINSVLAVPTLAQCIKDVEQEDGLDGYLWLKTVEKQYKKKTAKEMFVEDLEKPSGKGLAVSALEIAQIVLDSPCCKSLEVVKELLNGLNEGEGKEGYDDDDEG